MPRWEPVHQTWHLNVGKLSFVFQVMRHENGSILEVDGKEVSVFTPSKPREKWLRKRTHVKLRVGCVCDPHRPAPQIGGEGTEKDDKAPNYNFVLRTWARVVPLIQREGVITIVTG